MRRTTDHTRWSTESIEVELSDISVSQIIDDKSKFSKVFRANVPDKDDDKEYAMKVMRKDKLVKTKLSDSAMLELQILRQCNHPALLNLAYCF